MPTSAHQKCNEVLGQLHAKRLDATRIGVVGRQSCCSVIVQLKWTSGIYHAACHAVVLDGEAATDILESLYKGAFFTLQTLQYVRSGEYPHTKSELAKQLEGNEARILEVNRDWDTNRPSNEAEMRELTDLILGWAEGIICSSCK